VTSVTIRFYAELNDFLPPSRRGREWRRDLADTPSVKDLIESCGVPHPEVDLVLIDGVSVGFGQKITGGERIAVYPVFERLDLGSVQHLRPRPLRVSCFVVDANLGKLARLLRLLGFDALYDAAADDRTVVEQSLTDRRIILTRDRGLLMRKAVTHGYYVRSHRPYTQLREVVERLDLCSQCSPFSRCAECNGKLQQAELQQVHHRLPPRTRAHVTEVKSCATCGKLYWKGAHWPRLSRLVDDVCGDRHRIST
jgi:uncharacterized protein with PIN domain